MIFAAYAFITNPSPVILTNQEKQETNEYIDKIKEYVEVISSDPRENSLQDKDIPLLSYEDIGPEEISKISPLNEEVMIEGDSLLEKKLPPRAMIDSPKDTAGIMQDKLLNVAYNIFHTKPGKEFLEKILLSGDLNPDGRKDNKQPSQYINNSILDVVEGEGERRANCGDLVEVHYVARLVNGQEIENTKLKNKSVVFQIGDADVIKGLEYAVLGMREGGVRRLIVPPKFGYQEKKFSKNIVAGNEFISLDIELIKFKRPLEEGNINIFDENKDYSAALLCSTDVYFTYKLSTSDEKLIYQTMDKVHFRLGSSEVPTAINRAFLDIKTNSKRVIIMPGSLIYNKKTSFFPPNLSLPRKGMLVLEVYTFGKSE